MVSAELLRKLFNNDSFIFNDISDDGVAITTPYYDILQRLIQLFAVNDNGKIKITDNGWILHSLAKYNIKVDTSNLPTKGDELVVFTDSAHFKQDLKTLINKINKLERDVAQNGRQKTKTDSHEN